MQCVGASLYAPHLLCCLFPYSWSWHRLFWPRNTYSLGNYPSSLVIFSLHGYTTYLDQPFDCALRPHVVVGVVVVTFMKTLLISLVWPREFPNREKILYPYFPELYVGTFFPYFLSGGVERSIYQIKHMSLSHLLMF